MCTSVSGNGNNICLVAILKDEEPFLDEWIIYHRLIGIDHFFLYDDNPMYPLTKYLECHATYCTCINWNGMDKSNNIGRSNQTKAYNHAMKNFVKAYEWVVFLDGDEFITLRNHNYIKEFLKGFANASSISLNWHVFGHNGFYDDPKGLITASLIRRMYKPNSNVKSITRSKTIVSISSPHSCILQSGSRVDANNREYNSLLYIGKTDIAHINHYQCRSFKRWMNRVKRGCAHPDIENTLSTDQWRINEELCLRQFVTTVALDKNEYIDEFMLKYSSLIKIEFSKLGRQITESDI